MDEISIEFKDNKSVAFVGDSEIGVCEFNVLDDKWVIVHTEVNSNYRGSGIAKKLLDRVVDEARNKNIKIIPKCEYAIKVMVGKNEYSDVIE